ncbi:hypothetical protein PG996_015618 [Apiospora saccharicola]|uniref:Calcineurin-like phosphoesterase domain-containing protein n=1 Tax=Apiospora saccharicola TaxID=335842 RepID=A0ABR1TPB2_9PEZI
MPIKTRFLITSDTHSAVFDVKEGHKADVVIHCGDLSQYSHIDHYPTTIDLLRRLDAPLKLVIAGNHDQALQEDRYDDHLRTKLDWYRNTLPQEQIIRNFGPRGEPRRLLTSPEAKASGIVFLDEGNHSFHLQNGASMRVYACPWTPEAQPGRAFQYKEHEGHDFAIADNVQIAITHGPPRGILDWTSRNTLAGCPQLFGAMAQARPLIHCFGHIHGAWGAQVAVWKQPDDDGHRHNDNRRRSPRNVTVANHVDVDASFFVEKLPNLTRNWSDPPAAQQAKAEKKAEYDRQGFAHTSHCSDGDDVPLVPGQHTLFVNASHEGSTVGQAAGILEQWPWLVDIELPSVEEELARRRVNPYR